MKEFHITGQQSTFANVIQ